MEFKRATKRQSKARIAIYGPSGSGKTFSSLRIATGLAQPVALIDTERGSGSKYSDEFTFDALDLPRNDIETYVQAIHMAGRAGYGCLIIDSLSHAWQELLQEIDRLAAAKYKGNSWSAWSEGTPRQRQLVDALLQFPGHLIASMRAKTEWSTTACRDGKTRPVRVGLAPEQRAGVEYEFDILMSISADHIAYIEKDRSGRFQDRTIDKPGEEFGKEIAAWLGQGEEPRLPEGQVTAALERIRQADGETLDRAEQWLHQHAMSQGQRSLLRDAIDQRRESTNGQTKQASLLNE